MSCFRDKDVCNADNLPLCYGIARRCRVINTLVNPCVQAFELFIGIVGLPELTVIIRQLRCGDSHVVRVEMAEEGHRGGSGVSGNHVLDGGEVSVLERLE